MNWSTIVLVGSCVLTGIVVGYVDNSHYGRRIAQMQAEQARAIEKIQAERNKGLANATNTILLAQDEYNGLRAERDRLLARLRHAGADAGAGNSVEALGARVAELEKLVSRMAEAASRCGDGFERCAQKHDALAEAVKCATW